MYLNDHGITAFYSIEREIFQHLYQYNMNSSWYVYCRIQIQNMVWYDMKRTSSKYSSYDIINDNHLRRLTYFLDSC